MSSPARVLEREVNIRFPFYVLGLANTAGVSPRRQFNNIRLQWRNACRTGHHLGKPNVGEGAKP